MDDNLTIRIYPDNEHQAEQMDKLIQETLANEGVRGFVSVCGVVPDTLESLGISKLPAVAIGDIVVLQGRLPTGGDIVSWLDKLVPQEDRAPRSQTAKSGWPGSVVEAVALLVGGLSEREMLDIAAADDEALYLANGPLGWGQGIRDGFGLLAGNHALLQDCGTEHADDASLVIIRAVRNHLRYRR
jgi:hypothetical protein